MSNSSEIRRYEVRARQLQIDLKSEEQAATRLNSELQTRTRNLKRMRKEFREVRSRMNTATKKQKTTKSRFQVVEQMGKVLSHRKAKAAKVQEEVSKLKKRQKIVFTSLQRTTSLLDRVQKKVRGIKQKAIANREMHELEELRNLRTAVQSKMFSTEIGQKISEGENRAEEAVISPGDFLQDEIVSEQSTASIETLREERHPERVLPYHSSGQDQSGRNEFSASSEGSAGEKSVSSENSEETQIEDTEGSLFQSFRAWKSMRGSVVQFSYRTESGKELQFELEGGVNRSVSISLHTSEEQDQRIFLKERTKILHTLRKSGIPVRELRVQGVSYA